MRFLAILDPFIAVGWWILRAAFGKTVDGVCLIDLRLESKIKQIQLQRHLAAALEVLRHRDAELFEEVSAQLRFVAAVGLPRAQVI